MAVVLRKSVSWLHSLSLHFHNMELVFTLPNVRWLADWSGEAALCGTIMPSSNALVEIINYDENITHILNVDKDREIW